MPIFDDSARSEVRRVAAALGSTDQPFALDVVPSEPGSRGTSHKCQPVVVEESQPVVLAEREHRFAPPSWRMFDALVFELDQWVRLRPREVMPEVLEHERPGRVVWSSLWPVSPEDRIQFHLRPDGAGSAIRFEWTTKSPPDERGIGLVRHHLNEMIAGHLRDWVDTEERAR